MEVPLIGLLHVTSRAITLFIYFVVFFIDLTVGGGTGFWETERGDNMQHGANRGNPTGASAVRTVSSVYGTPAQAIELYSALIVPLLK